MLEALSVLVLVIGGTMFAIAPSTDDSVASTQQDQAKVEYVAQNAKSEQPKL
jgi:hypothetical protein